MSGRLILTVLVLTSWRVSFSVADQTRIYVNWAAVNGANDGANWTDAYVDLQAALAEASQVASPSNPVEIWVAQGIYRPHGCEPNCNASHRAATFDMLDNVNLYGGFMGGETNLSGRPSPDPDNETGYTTLSGDLQANDASDVEGFIQCFSGSTIPFGENCGSFDIDSDGDVDAVDGGRDDNSLHVVTYASPNAAVTIDQFRIVGGNADESAAPGNQGGAINIRGALFCILGGPTISNCLIKGNLASDHGAVNDHGTGSVMTNCRFEYNYSTHEGAGLLIHSGSPTVTNCTFIKNRCDGDGGAVWAGFDAEHQGDPDYCVASNPTFVGCEFQDNKANGEPFGVCGPPGPVCHAPFGSGVELCSPLDQNACQDHPEACFLAGRGGAVFIKDAELVQMIDCVFTHNIATNQGGALWVANTDSLLISGPDSTGEFINNEAPDGGAIWVEGQGVLPLACQEHAVTISECDFEDNKAEFIATSSCSDACAPGRGGAIFVDKVVSPSAEPPDAPDCVMPPALPADPCSVPPPASAAVTIDGCRFEQNTATRGAGAVWIEDSNVVKISNTRFIGNAITLEAADYECTPVGENFCGQEFNFPGGAALWMNTPNLLKVSPEFEDVDGDGAVDIIFPQCQELTPVGPFPLNCSNKDVIGGNLHMSDCVFEGNTACTGTHSFYTEGTDVFMEDSIIRGNFGGAGAYINSFFPGTAGEQSACLRNLLVVGNRAISKGSGVVTFINNLKVENATFANNNIGLGNHPALSVKHQNYDWCSRAVVTNSIFAGNTGSDLDPFFDNVAAFGSCDLRITYSDLPPAWAACEGGREPDTCPDGSSTDKCVYGDPMFVGDYYLDVLSPCVGKGDCCLSASCEPEPGGPVVPDCPAEQSADPGTTDCDQDVDVERLDLGYHHPQGPPPVDCLLYCETDCCETIKDCADGDDDGIRDDGCMWWACESGICAGTDIVFADMGGPNDCCLPDGTADANDKFHALRCFTDTDISGSPGNPCEASPPVAFNVDAGGPFGDCAPDGVCDGNDAFHALNAFGMVSACSCPSGSSPATTIAANVQVRSTSTPGIIQPGQQVRVRVFFVTALPDVRGYQLHLRPSGGTSGELELVDMAIENRSDAVFYNHGAWEAFNADSEQLVAGLDGNGIATAANAYLATYLYQASPDASGWFTFNLLYDNPNGTSRTFLFPTAPNSKIKITSYTAARVKVQF